MMRVMLFIVEIRTSTEDGRQVVVLECGHLVTLELSRESPKKLWDEAGCPKGCYLKNKLGDMHQEV